MDDDRELLKGYVDGRSQAAFEQLVKRHGDLVYSAARRQVKNLALAEDVSQAVFLILARKAHRFRGIKTLHGWLLKTTYFAARNALRLERRRKHYENEAAAMKAEIGLGNTEDQTGGPIAAQLDAAMAKLSDADRNLIALRYFEGKSARDAAAALGISELAAAKRTTRAVERLRDYFFARNITLAAGSLEIALAAQKLVTAPASLASSIVAPSARALEVSGAVVKAAAIKGALVAGASLLATAMITVVIVAVVLGPKAAGKIDAGPTKRPMNQTAVSVRDSSLDGYPIPKPWPMALPGEVCCTPVVADVDGDGKLEIIVTSRHRDPNATNAHPEPNVDPLIFAIRPDGTVLPGWPIRLAPAQQKMLVNGSAWGGWASSPSVYHRNGHDELVIMGTPGATYIISPGKVRKLRGGAITMNVPLVDLDGDGIPDLVHGLAQSNVDGQRIKTWPIAKKLRNGYAPCIGDALGDGQLKMYHLFSTTKGTNLCDVMGVDRNGDPLPGWPQVIDDPSWLAPVMGDIDGDGKMEVVASYGSHVFAWTWDGKPLPCDTEDGELKAVFKSNVSAFTSTPTLADLDGDGKAEIIVFDQSTMSIRAWHGDGKGVGNEDGIIAELPVDCHGISVANLSGGDVVDLFAGSYWVKFNFKTSKSQIVNICPGDPPSDWTQPTICDVDGDGKADVLFGLSDGRVFIYNTGLSYRAEEIQWATGNHDFQHTGCWKAGGRK